MEPRSDEKGDGSVGATSGTVLEVLSGGRPGGLSVYEASFPARVAAFLRYSPVIEAAQTARRRGWADGAYDIVTLALTAIDLVVSRQGFEEEATRADVVSATGKPIGTQTFRVAISGGEIVDRRRAEDDDNCETESYEPI